MALAGTLIRSQRSPTRLKGVLAHPLASHRLGWPSEESGRRPKQTSRGGDKDAGNSTMTRLLNSKRFRLARGYFPKSVAPWALGGVLTRIELPTADVHGDSLDYDAPGDA